MWYSMVLAETSLFLELRKFQWGWSQEYGFSKTAQKKAVCVRWARLFFRLRWERCNREHRNMVAQPTTIVSSKFLYGATEKRQCCTIEKRKSPGRFIRELCSLSLSGRLKNWKCHHDRDDTANHTGNILEKMGANFSKQCHKQKSLIFSPQNKKLSMLLKDFSEFHW